MAVSGNGTSTESTKKRLTRQLMISNSTGPSAYTNNKNKPFIYFINPSFNGWFNKKIALPSPIRFCSLVGYAFCLDLIELQGQFLAFE